MPLCSGPEWQEPHRYEDLWVNHGLLVLDRDAALTSLRLTLDELVTIPVEPADVLSHCSFCNAAPPGNLIVREDVISVEPFS